MDYVEAKELIKKLEQLLESKGVDHHSTTEERKGKERYIKFEASIKIK